MTTPDIERCGVYIGKIPNTIRVVDPKEWCANPKPCKDHEKPVEELGAISGLPLEDLRDFWDKLNELIRTVNSLINR